MRRVRSGEAVGPAGTGGFGGGVGGGTVPPPNSGGGSSGGAVPIQPRDQVDVDYPYVLPGPHPQWSSSAAASASATASASRQQPPMPSGTVPPRPSPVSTAVEYATGAAAGAGALSPSSALSPPSLLHGNPVLDLGGGMGVPPPPLGVLQPDLASPRSINSANSANSSPAVFTFGAPQQQQSNGMQLGQQYNPPAKRRKTMEAAFGDLTIRQSGSGSGGFDSVGSATGSPSGGGSLASGGGLGSCYSSEVGGVIPSPPVRDALGILGTSASSLPGMGTRGSIGGEESIAEEGELPRGTAAAAAAIGVGGGLGRRPDNPQDVVPSSPSLSDLDDSDTDAGMDEASDLPDLGLMASRGGSKFTSANPVDERIEEMIRTSRLRAMVEAKLSLSSEGAAQRGGGKKKDGGKNGKYHDDNVLRTRDDFELQGTFDTTGRSSDGGGGGGGGGAAGGRGGGRTTPTMANSSSSSSSSPPLSASSATAAAAAKGSNPISVDLASVVGRVPAGVQRGRQRGGRERERGSSRRPPPPRSRSLPRQLEGLSMSSSRGGTASTKKSAGGDVDMTTS